MPEQKLKKTAEEFAKEEKEISVSEFFEKNKHLLGFDNPTKSLLMAVKEPVDNSIDAAEEAGVLPDIVVKIKATGEDKHRVAVQDNGPGIVKEQLSKTFGKMLYGSKFHRLRQSRGQQGIGISAVVLYSQLTTGKPMAVWSQTDEKKKVYHAEIFLDTAKNEPHVVKEATLDDKMFPEGHGLKVEMELVGRYRKTQSVDDYLKQTSIANPFARIIYQAPDGTKITFPRSIEQLPRPPKQIKMHPYGVEFGILQRLLKRTASRSVHTFLMNEFSSVGNHAAMEICKVAKLAPEVKPTELTREQAEKLLHAMQKVKLQRPPTDCLSPIGEKELERSLKKEYQGADFICTVTREPEVYKGNPFQIEVGVVYGVPDRRDNEQVEMVRLANRVPLLYQAGACATVEAMKEIDWKRYSLQQSGSNLPTGSVVIVIHMCSVWVPFVSESKEAIAPYPEIVKEMKLALQDAGRRLSLFLSGKRKAGEQKRKIQIFERYAHEVASALGVLTKKNPAPIEEKIKQMVESRIHVKEEFEQAIEKEEEHKAATQVAVEEPTAKKTVKVQPSPVAAQKEVKETAKASSLTAKKDVKAAAPDTKKKETKK